MRVLHQQNSRDPKSVNCIISNYIIFNWYRFYLMTRYCIQKHLLLRCYWQDIRRRSLRVVALYTGRKSILMMSASFLISALFPARCPKRLRLWIFSEFFCQFFSTYSFFSIDDYNQIVLRVLLKQFFTKNCELIQMFTLKFPTELCGKFKWFYPVFINANKHNKVDEPTRCNLIRR